MGKSDKSDPPNKPPSKPPVPMLETDALLYDPEVRKVIRLKLIRDLHIPESEANELEGDVITKCWEDRLKEEDPPDTIGRWQAYARVRANGMGVDWIRAREVQAEAHSKILAGDATSETPGSSGREKMDVERALGEFDRMPKHQHANALFDAVQSGDGPSAASEELGLRKQQAHNIVSTTRERYIKWLKAAGMAAILPAGVSVWFLFFQPVELQGGRPDGWARTDVSEPPPVLAETKAADLRKEAADECAQQQWDACKYDLQSAASMDPAGSTAPDLQAMLQQANDAIELREMNAKPGRFYRPLPKKK